MYSLTFNFEIDMFLAKIGNEILKIVTGPSTMCRLDNSLRFQAKLLRFGCPRSFYSSNRVRQGSVLYIVVSKYERNVLLKLPYHIEKDAIGCKHGRFVVFGPSRGYCFGCHTGDTTFTVQVK